jgi:hypothetical protein
MMHVQLPDRKYITLCEAVTAFVYGAPRDSSSGPFEETDDAPLALEKELYAAASAGKVRFRGLKAGNNKYQEIDPVYFSTRHNIDFNWNKNLIRFRIPDWYDVHLDREQFASLLKDMGVSVEPDSNSNAPPDSTIYCTGVAGRRTSRHIVELEAQRRLDAGDCPETLTAFSQELAAWLKKTEPRAPSMTAKTIYNSLLPKWQRHKRPK